MGQARAYRQRFFERHPYCCFCGGKAKAEEIEHIPPRFMFVGKHRPIGFEFPTCEPCNRASRKTDTVVTFLARFASPQDHTKRLDNEFGTVAKALRDYCPETFDEIVEGRFGNRREEKKLRLTFGEKLVVVSLGPKQREHIQLFGLKLTLATYYQVTGMIASISARVAVYPHTSKNIIEGTVPTELNFLGNFSTMRQGSWSVPEQFSYRYGTTDNKNSAVFQFLLHENLLLSTFLFDDPANEKAISRLETITIAALQPVKDEKRNSLPTLSLSTTQ